MSEWIKCSEQMPPNDDMIKRQADTGQEVHIRSEITDYVLGSLRTRYFDVVTDKPDWNIPGAEYSFNPFSEK